MTHNKPNDVRVPPFASKVIAKLHRFQECTDGGQCADIGRHWFDLLTQLGLLYRVQRSPALWEITQQGEDLLDDQRAPPADQQGEPVAIAVVTSRTDHFESGELVRVNVEITAVARRSDLTCGEFLYLHALPATVNGGQP